MSAQQRLQQMEGQYSQAADEALNEVTVRGKNFADAWRSKANEQIGISQEDKEQLDELVTGAGLAVQMGQAGFGKVQAYRAQQAAIKAAKLGKSGAADAEKAGTDAVETGKGTVADLASAGKGRLASLAESAKSKLGSLRTAVSDARDRVGELSDEVRGAVGGTRSAIGEGSQLELGQFKSYMGKIARGVSPSEMGGGEDSASSALEGGSGAAEDATVEVSGLAKSTVGGASRFVRGFRASASSDAPDLFGARSVVSDAARSARYRGSLATESEAAARAEAPLTDPLASLSSGASASKYGGGWLNNPERPVATEEVTPPAEVSDVQPVVSSSEKAGAEQLGGEGGGVVAKQVATDEGEDLGAEGLEVDAAAGVGEIGLLSTVGAAVAPIAIAAGVILGIKDLLDKPSAHDPPPPPSISTAASRGSGVLPSVNNVVDTPASASAF